MLNKQALFCFLFFCIIMQFRFMAMIQIYNNLYINSFWVLLPVIVSFICQTGETSIEWSKFKLNSLLYIVFRTKCLYYIVASSFFFFCCLYCSKLLSEWVVETVSILDKKYQYDYSCFTGTDALLFMITGGTFDCTVLSCVNKILLY